MKLLLLTLLLLASCSFADASSRERKESDIDPSLDAIGHKIAWNLEEQGDTSWITDEIRPIVIERLSYRLGHDFNRSYNPTLERYLIILGDVPTIKKYLAEVWAHPHPEGMERGMPDAPAALPYMMDIVYHGSSVPGPWEKDYAYYTNQRESACMWVLQVLHGFAQEHGVPFPKETQEWSRKMREGRTYLNKGGVELIQQWHEQNKAAIDKGHYNEASWLPRYKGELFINSTAQREDRLAAEARSHRALRRPVFSAAVASFSQSKMFWPTLAAAVALLAACIFYFRRRARGTENRHH